MGFTRASACFQKKNVHDFAWLNLMLFAQPGVLCYSFLSLSRLGQADFRVVTGMAGRAKKKEKGEHMRRYYGHYPQCPIGAPKLRVKGPGPTSIRAFKLMHASHVIP